MLLRLSQVPTFCRERANELRKLADLLETEGLVQDAGPLRSAASQCQQPNQTNWAYNVSALYFLNAPPPTVKHARPQGAELSRIELSVQLIGKCLVPGAHTDPFDTLAVDIYLEGIAEISTSSTSSREESQTQLQELSCAWHLDRHIVGEDDEDGTPSAAHPIYHFQHGGRRMWDLVGIDYGKQLLLEAPRLAHPPLDAILAVDFILSNYYGPRWIKLLNNSEYTRLVSSSQERFWRPYSIATASIWQRAQFDTSWKAADIWPQLAIFR